MPKLTQKHKITALGLVSVVFVATAYLTFFKTDTAPIPKPSVIVKTPSPGPGTIPLSLPADTLNDAVPGPVGKNSVVRFQPRIRNIFISPVSNLKNSSTKSESAPKTLSDAEKKVIRDILVFKGAILHGNQSVAVINGAFFHIGDFVNGYKLVHISEKEAWVDTQRGILKLEIMTHD